MTSQMKQTLHKGVHWSEFQPSGRPATRFPIDLDKIDGLNASARRSNMLAYCGYVYPSNQNLQDVYQFRAEQLACSLLHQNKVANVSETYFAWLSDRYYWKVFFELWAEEKQPNWPFVMMQVDQRGPNAAKYAEWMAANAVDDKAETSLGFAVKSNDGQPESSKQAAAPNTAATNTRSTEKPTQSPINETRVSFATNVEIARLTEKLRAAELDSASKDTRLEELTKRYEQLDNRLKMVLSDESATSLKQFDKINSMQKDVVSKERQISTLQRKEEQLRSEAEILTAKCQGLQDELVRQNADKDKVIKDLQLQLDRTRAQRVMVSESSASAAPFGRLPPARRQPSQQNKRLKRSRSPSQSLSEVAQPTQPQDSHQLTSFYTQLGVNAAHIRLVGPEHAYFNLEQLSRDLVFAAASPGRMQSFGTFLREAPPSLWYCVRLVSDGYAHCTPIDPSTLCLFHGTNCLAMAVVGTEPRVLNFTHCRTPTMY